VKYLNFSLYFSIAPISLDDKWVEILCYLSPLNCRKSFPENYQKKRFCRSHTSQPITFLEGGAYITVGMSLVKFRGEVLLSMAEAQLTRDEA